MMNTEEIPGQLISLTERFVLSFEKIAKSLGEISEAYQKKVAKEYPQRFGPRDAKVTRVPTEEDRLREAQGASSVPIDDWLSELEGDDIGMRERQWLSEQERNAGSQAAG